jgi:hypothetical protein
MLLVHIGHCLAADGKSFIPEFLTLSLRPEGGGFFCHKPPFGLTKQTICSSKSPSVGL